MPQHGTYMWLSLANFICVDNDNTQKVKSDNSKMGVKLISNSHQQLEWNGEPIKRSRWSPNCKRNKQLQFDLWTTENWAIKSFRKENNHASNQQTSIRNIYVTAFRMVQSWNEASDGKTLTESLQCQQHGGTTAKRSVINCNWAVIETDLIFHKCNAALQHYTLQQYK